MSNYAKRYDEEFKVQAVDLLRTSGKPVAQVARELGVSVATLRTWKRRQLGGTPGPVEDQDLQYKEKAALFDENRGARLMRRANPGLEHNPAGVARVGSLPHNRRRLTEYRKLFLATAITPRSAEACLTGAVSP